MRSEAFDSRAIDEECRRGETLHRALQTLSNEVHRALEALQDARALTLGMADGYRDTQAMIYALATELDQQKRLNNEKKRTLRRYRIRTIATLMHSLAEIDKELDAGHQESAQLDHELIAADGEIARLEQQLAAERLQSSSDEQLNQLTIEATASIRDEYEVLHNENVLRALTTLPTPEKVEAFLRLCENRDGRPSTSRRIRALLGAQQVLT